jgi:hypothetical protein
MNFDNKYKRRRERDEETGERGVYKNNTVSKYFENACEQLANSKRTLSEIFQRYPSMYARHYKSLERIVYERDRLKKRPVLDITWIYGPSDLGEIELADEYLKSYHIFYKVGNYYQGLNENNSLVFDPLEKEKYSDLLQMFTDNHVELKVKYGYYNFLPEKLIFIYGDHPREWCSKCKPRVNDCSELLKKINRIIKCDWDYKTKTPIYTEWRIEKG